MKKSYFLKGLLVLVLSITLLGYGLQQTISKSHHIVIPVFTGSTLLGNGASKTNSCFHEPQIEYFMYHYIREADPHDAPSTRDLSIDPQVFRAQMAYIRNLANKGDITLMNGVDFLSSMQSGCFPGKRVWIFTSDDGWSDTYTNLVPIARTYTVPFFLGIIWNRTDTHGFVTSQQVTDIATNPLFTIASHSMTHSDQDKMSEGDERIEICTSKKLLEALIHTEVLTYIYPAGRMSNNSQHLTKECGYTLAWSTQFGTKWNPKNPSKYNINRIRIHNHTTIEVFNTILKQ